MSSGDSARLPKYGGTVVGAVATATAGLKAERRGIVAMRTGFGEGRA